MNDRLFDVSGEEILPGDLFIFADCPCDVFVLVCKLKVDGSLSNTNKIRYLQVAKRTGNFTTQTVETGFFFRSELLKLSEKCHQMI